MKTTLFLLAAATIAQASPVPELDLVPRQQKALCELYAYWSGNGYELLNNLWGKDSATSGSQCTYLDGTANGGIQWSTTWTWKGGENNVKSYPYVGRQVARGKTIASIQKMPTSVTWQYSTENIRANVAYDVFTSADPNGPNNIGDYELMVWLARLGNVYPIGQKVATVTIAGYTWDLWTGYNGKMRVYSFIPPSGTIKSFTADIKDFFKHLEQNYQYPASTQNLIIFQIGSEAFTGGPATFKCTQFTADVIIHLEPHAQCPLLPCPRISGGRCCECRKSHVPDDARNRYCEYRMAPETQVERGRAELVVGAECCGAGSQLSSAGGARRTLAGQLGWSILFWVLS